MAGFAFSLLAFIYYLKRRELVAFQMATSCSSNRSISDAVTSTNLV